MAYRITQRSIERSNDTGPNHAWIAITGPTSRAETCISSLAGPRLGQERGPDKIIPVDDPVRGNLGKRDRKVSRLAGTSQLGVHLKHPA
jgi:hypothetical protein